MNTELLRGALDLCVLCLARVEPVYGYALVERLGARGLPIAAGTVYPTLGRLRRRGLLEGHEQTGPSGQTRTCYSLTEDGRVALQELAADWAQLGAAVAGLLASLSEPVGTDVDQEAVDA